MIVERKSVHTYIYRKIQVTYVVKHFPHPLSNNLGYIYKTVCDNKHSLKENSCMYVLEVRVTKFEPMHRDRIRMNILPWLHITFLRVRARVGRLSSETTRR